MNISLTNWKVCCRQGREGEVSEQAAMGELMTHLWLRVTQGSGPFEEVRGARATSEHM